MASSFTSTSNSFLFTPSPAPHSKPKTHHHPNRVLVLAKAGGNGNPFASFRLRKPSADDSPSSSSGDAQGGNGNSNPFSFNLSKLSDVKSLIPVVSNRSGLGVNSRQKDTGTVFVAGAEGLLGIRIAQALLRQGFKVRAGVSDLDSAQELARFAANYKIISTEESKRLNAVESQFDSAESIAKSIGNASKVVVTIGPFENGSATTEVTTSDAIQVVEAAQLAGVSHVAIIYDESALNTSTYNVLDGITSFFNNLFAKSQPLTVPEFLQRVVETDVRYTFIKTKLTDDFGDEREYGVVVKNEGSGSPDDYKVSKTVMASLVADLFSNTAVAENKVVEVCTDPSASSKPIYELFSAIPEDGRRQVYAEAQAKAEEEAITASEKAREAAEAAKKLEEEVKMLSEQETKAASLAEEAGEKAEVAGVDVESLLSKAKDFGSGLSWGKLGSQLATAVQGNAVDDGSMGIPKVQVATVRGQAKARSLPAQQARVKSNNLFAGLKAATPKKAEAKKEQVKGKESKKETRSVLGGLFKQETIYVDDD